MVLIEKGQANTVTVTVTEKTTIESPTYLFSFTNDLTGLVKTCISENTSTATERYDRFVITEKTSSPNNLIGEITLTNEGFWSYKIYAQESTTNLIPADADELVEQGKARITGTANAETEYTNTDTDEIKVYNG